VIDFHSKKPGASWRIAFAAFMDRAAKFELQSYYWARSLIETGTVEDPRDIYLFVPECLHSPPEWAVRAGIRVMPIPYWDARHPYCNKIGLWRDELFASYSHACFTDCDMMFVRRPDLPVTQGIAAAIVDSDNPKWPRLAQVFTGAGLPLPDPVPVRWSYVPRRITAPANCNGGFYLVNQHLIGPLGSAWSRWARWLLDNPAIGKPLRANVDQVAMALALTETKQSIDPFPATVNVPTHRGKLPDTFPVPPTVLHYHSHLDDQGCLCATGTHGVDEAVADANRMIERWKGDGAWGDMKHLVTSQAT
jgi:hypothetical protein